MVMRNIVNYRKQAYAKKGLFVYLGTTALKKGYGMCFDMAYANALITGEKATDPFGARGLKVIQKPVAANSMAFAGILTQDYPARASGLQLVELYLPGGCAKLAIGGLSTVNNLTTLTCQIGPDAGRFTLGGFVGRGSALALQTKTIADITDLAFASLDGTATEATDTGVYTITKTGIGTACGYNAAAPATPLDAATNYTCVVLGGGDDDEGAVTPKVVNVLTAPSADTITVSAPTGTTPFISLYVYKSNPMILAYLYDGEESGLVEFVSPSDMGVAQHALISGVTFVCGGYTLTTAPTTAETGLSTLADGIRDGQRKGFINLGVLTTQGYKVSVTSGLKAIGTALTSILIAAADGAGTYSMLRWSGNFGTGILGLWRVESGNATEA